MAFVAGSIGPLGALVKPYGSLTLVQVREIFEEQAGRSWRAASICSLLETFGSLLEAAEAVRAVRGLSAEIPIVAQMTFLSDGRTAFGESASHALSTLALAGADAVGMNCTLGPQETHDVFVRLPASIPAPLSVMPNAGYPTVVHGRNVYLSSPDYLRDYAAAFVEAGAAIVGGCCGTTPEHIRAMASAIAGRPGTATAPGLRRSRARSTGRRARDRDLPLEAQARRSRRVRRHGRGRAPEGRRRLGGDRRRARRAAGVDAVNVTDNPMARLRMSSIAVAALIQRETGLDAVVQITTRDRNVLGLQSDLLGAAGLGLKAILCLGGDPLKIGDYPQAKQVSEVDVLGLLRIAKGLNGGADLAGNAIGAATAFAIGCAANPAATDMEVELSSSARRSRPARPSRRRSRSTTSARSRASSPAKRPGRSRSSSGSSRSGPSSRPFSSPTRCPASSCPRRSSSACGAPTSAARPREGGGARDRAGARGGDRRARPRDPHHADGQVRAWSPRSSTPCRRRNEGRDARANARTVADDFSNIS